MSLTACKTIPNSEPNINKIVTVPEFYITDYYVWEYVDNTHAKIRLKRLEDGQELIFDIETARYIKNYVKLFSDRNKELEAYIQYYENILK